MKLNIATLAVILFAAIVFALNTTHVAWTPWHIAGLAIAAPALLLLVVARLQLGRAFSIEAKASVLVTTGLYSKIRNPIYVFGALMIFGLIIFSSQLWFLLVFAALIPMQVLRSRRESRVLEEKFGAAYLDYRRRTWF
jgi:protein-S-isoprenylcysteine O-methyltransferase Ste14